MSRVAPRARPRWNDATATTGTQIELARRRAIVAGYGEGARPNMWADTGSAVPMALAAQPCECPAVPSISEICLLDYSDVSAAGVLETVYQNYEFLFHPIFYLTPTPMDPLRPFNTCLYTGPPFVVSGPSPYFDPNGVLVPGGYYSPPFIRRYCFTVIPQNPMNAIRIGFAADDAVALRIAGMATPLLMRWSVAAAPSFGGDYVYSDEFSIGCTHTDFELVTANAPWPNDYYELSVFWINSPGPFATQAQLNAQPKLNLGALYWQKATCPGPC